MITRQELIEKHPLVEFISGRGVPLLKNGVEFETCCPFHSENTPSFSVNPDKNVWHCFGCGRGGSVIDFVMFMDKLNPAEAMAKLAGDETVAPVGRREQPRVIMPSTKKSEPAKIVKTYDYTNESGEMLYQVCRLDPKSFRQRHMVDGIWQWNMDGVNRVLYNLRQVLKASRVWIVEGEKDADNLNKLGLVATTSVGGAGKWLDGYNSYLKGKEVVLCGDNDEPGRKHVAQVLEALAGKVKSVRTVQVPSPFKDVSDYLASGEVTEMGNKLAALAEQAPELIGGVDIPVYSLGELEAHYTAFSQHSTERSLSFKNWLPSLGNNVRGLVGGELVTILADTGVGKTAILQNIAMHAAPLTVLLFELELPGTLTFERFVQLATRRTGQEVQDRYAKGEKMAWRETNKINHVHICPLSKLTPDDIEKLILRSELKIGRRPDVVMIDYIGLISGKGASRYERISSVAEQMKVLAKETNTIVILASQIHRKESDSSIEVFLHDAKDSGSVENSSGLVLGAWRDASNSETLHVKVLKNTKGKAGFTIPCDFQGETLLITEQMITKAQLNAMKGRMK